MAIRDMPQGDMVGTAMQHSTDGECSSITENLPKAASTALSEYAP